MEQVFETDSGVIFHLCGEGRGIGLIKNTGSALQRAAAGVKWRGWRDSSPSPSPTHQERGGGVQKSPLPWWEGDRERGRRSETQLGQAGARQQAGFPNAPGLRQHRDRHPQQLPAEHRAGARRWGTRGIGTTGSPWGTGSSTDTGWDPAALRHLAAAQPEAVTQTEMHPSAAQRCDSRYRGIVSRLDALLELFHLEPERNLAAEMDVLLEAMSEQFGSENDCMILVGFPQALVHSVRHQAICFEAAKVRYRFSTGRPVSYSDLALLRMLCMQHIESYDANFERFLAPRGDYQSC